MKNSALFLGLTTTLLAIAEVISAKVTRFGSYHTAYYKVGNTVFTTATGCSKAQAIDICTGAVKTVDRYLFTNSACTHLFTYSNRND